MPITYFAAILQLDMNEKVYIYFSEMKLHVFFTSQFFKIFFCGKLFFSRILEEKVKKSHIK